MPAAATATADSSMLDRVKRFAQQAISTQEKEAARMTASVTAAAKESAAFANDRSSTEKAAIERLDTALRDLKTLAKELQRRERDTAQTDAAELRAKAKALTDAAFQKLQLLKRGAPTLDDFSDDEENVAPAAKVSKKKR